MGIIIIIILTPSSLFIMCLAHFFPIILLGWHHDCFVLEVNKSIKFLTNNYNTDTWYST